MGHRGTNTKTKNKKPNKHAESSERVTAGESVDVLESELIRAQEEQDEYLANDLLLDRQAIDVLFKEMDEQYFHADRDVSIACGHRENLMHAQIKQAEQRHKKRIADMSTMEVNCHEALLQSEIWHLRSKAFCEMADLTSQLRARPLGHLRNLLARVLKLSTAICNATQLMLEGTRRKCESQIAAVNVEFANQKKCMERLQEQVVDLEKALTHQKNSTQQTMDSMQMAIVSNQNNRKHMPRSYSHSRGRPHSRDKHATRAASRVSSVSSAPSSRISEKLSEAGIYPPIQQKDMPRVVAIIHQDGYERATMLDPKTVPEEPADNGLWLPSYVPAIESHTLNPNSPPWFPMTVLPSNQVPWIVHNSVSPVCNQGVSLMPFWVPHQ